MAGELRCALTLFIVCSLVVGRAILWLWLLVAVVLATVSWYLLYLGTCEGNNGLKNTPESNFLYQILKYHFHFYAHTSLFQAFFFLKCAMGTSDIMALATL